MLTLYGIAADGLLCALGFAINMEMVLIVTSFVEFA